jgi:hypothetical protein
MNCALTKVPTPTTGKKSLTFIEFFTRSMFQHMQYYLEMSCISRGNPTGLNPAGS